MNCHKIAVHRPRKNVGLCDLLMTDAEKSCNGVKEESRGGKGKMKYKWPCSGCTYMCLFTFAPEPQSETSYTCLFASARFYSALKCSTLGDS